MPAQDRRSRGLALAIVEHAAQPLAAYNAAAHGGRVVIRRLDVFVAERLGVDPKLTTFRAEFVQAATG